MMDSPVTATFERAPIDDPRIDALLAAVRETHANGGALLARFAARPTSRVRWHFRHGQIGNGQHDFSPFFASPALAHALPELRADTSTDPHDHWEWTGPFVLDGELTQTLVFGGAYDHFRGSPKEAKRLAEAFCDALFGDRYHDIDVFRTYAAWSSWFQRVAWDSSWLILDHGMNCVWLLCVTDRD